MALYSSDPTDSIRAYTESNAYHSGTDIARDVECSVEHCYYNKGRKRCTAGHIQIGPINAATTDDTICATFKKQ